MSDQLGKFEAVALREVWRREDGNFTPWLADNLSVLGDALGLPLEIKDTESGLDGLPYRVDIVAACDGQPVVIENQLEPTDDDHLGRLLVYAAGKNAKTVIWVASEMADAHWQAMHWLNQQQGAAKFYGVVVELLKIGNSKPAPYFKVVVVPGDMRERNTGGRVAVNAGLERAENHIFSVWLEQKLWQEHNFRITNADGNQPWVVLDTPRKGVRYALDLQRAGMYVSFQLHTDNGEQTLDWCQQLYDRLAESKEGIESVDGLLGEGETAEWLRNWQNNRGCQIAIHQNFDVRNNYESWGEYHDWIISKFFKFKEVFDWRLDKLLAQMGDSPEAAE